MYPFFLFVIFKVHASAVVSVSRLLFLVRIMLFLKKPMFSTENCTVLVALIFLPWIVMYLGLVYSPTLRR